MRESAGTDLKRADCASSAGEGITPTAPSNDVNAPVAVSFEERSRQRPLRAGAACIGQTAPSPSP